MNNFNTFLLTSSINTDSGVFSPSERLEQTLKTIESIRRKAPSSCIVFIDTQTIPLTFEQKEIISKDVDHYVDHKPNLLEKVCRDVFQPFKSIGEYFLYDDLFNYLKQNNLVGKRIFKISGRYKLEDSFDINLYESSYFKGKYVFHKSLWVIGDWQTKEEKEMYYLDTKLWSMCGSLLNDFHELLQSLLKYSIWNPHEIELALSQLLNPDKIVVLPKMHVEGYVAHDGSYVSE